MFYFVRHGKTDYSQRNEKIYRGFGVQLAPLSEKGVAARGGFHCSTLAHHKMNTEKRGTCRLSIGPMNTEQEILKLIGIIHEISKNI